MYSKGTYISIVLTLFIKKIKPRPWSNCGCLSQHNKLGLLLLKNSFKIPNKLEEKKHETLKSIINFNPNFRQEDVRYYSS